MSATPGKATATVRQVLDAGVPAWVLERELHDLGWLGDEVAIDRRPGGHGLVREGAEVRQVAVDQVGDREIRFRWWRVGEGPVSEVRLAVEQHEGGARLIVEEALLVPPGPPGASARASASTVRAREAWWGQRLDRLAVRCGALVPA